MVSIPPGYCLQPPLHSHLFLLFSGLGTLSAILGTTLQAVSHAGSIERTANDVITYTREVFHTTATYEYDAVFLKVVAFTGDVGVNLLGVGETHTGHLTHG